MTTMVEFPGLGIQLNISRVAFTLFGIDIYWYGVCIGLGMALALLMAFRNCKSFGIDTDRLIDVVFLGVVGAIVGGRLYYVLFSDQQFNSFIDLINLRKGGIAIYGGIIGAFALAAIGCKWRKVPMLPVFDLAGMGFLIGQCLGRWGNFFNQEAFGINTQLPWGMYSPATRYYLQQHQNALAVEGIVVDPGLPVHPTFLYESLWCLLGFVLLYAYRKRRKFHGELFLFYIIWYGTGRFFIEGLRTDSLMLWGMRASQLLAGLSVLAALAVWVMLRRKNAGKPLEVPPLPPRTATVKVMVGDKEEKVKISWPGGDEEPGAEARREMALKALQQQEQPLQEEPPKTGEEPASEAENEAPLADAEASNKAAPPEGPQKAKEPKPAGPGGAGEQPAAPKRQPQEGKADGGTDH